MVTQFYGDGFTVWVSGYSDGALVVAARFELPVAPSLWAPRDAWTRFHDASDRVLAEARAYRAELEGSL